MSRIDYYKVAPEGVKAVRALEHYLRASALEPALSELVKLRASLMLGAPPRETVTVAANVPIPNLPGKRLVSRVIDYPPRGGSVPHRHARSAFIYAYVLSGLIRSQLDDEPACV